MRWSGGPGIPRQEGDVVRHAEALASFEAYCEAHAAERFWQALRNWATERYGKKCHFVMVAERDTASDLAEDTFDWEG